MPTSVRLPAIFSGFTDKSIQATSGPSFYPPKVIMNATIPEQESSLDVRVTSHAVITSDQLNMIHALNSFEAPYLEEKLVKSGIFATSTEYRDAFVEFKKYAALTVIYRKPLAMKSKTVDEVWHQFILFTREYATFCTSILGRFLHHSPVTTLTPAAPDGVMNFVRSYREVFGDPPPIWDATGRGAILKDYGLSGLVADGANCSSDCKGGCNCKE